MTILPLVRVFGHYGFPSFVGGFWDYLPGESGVSNPFNRFMYGPVDGVAYSSGQIGFEPVSPVDVIRGYRITAQGELVDEPPLFEVSELR